MLVKDVVKRINKELATITKHAEIFNPIHSKNVDLVSQRFVQEMRELLDLYSESDVEADDNTLSALISQLEKYASFVLDTNAVHQHNSKTHANQLYLYIATELSKIVDIHPYKLFLPSLDVDARNLKAYDVALDRTILSDDNHTIIYVCDAFVAGRNKKGWKHTHPINGIVDLSDNEKYRLANFTHQTLRYFNDIEKTDVSERRLNKAKNDMLKNMYFQKIRATYGELGEARLTTRLYPNRKKLTHEELFDLLSAYPAHMKGKYLAGFSPEELKKIALQGSTLEKEISNSKHYNGNLKHDSAVLFTWLELYRQDTKDRTTEYKTLLGRVTGYGIPKSIKETAATVVYMLMQQNVPLNELRATALKMFSEDKTISDQDKPFFLRSLDQGTLGQWVSEAERVAEPKKKATHWFGRK